MKKKILWILLALAVVAAVLLIAFHPWSNGETADPEPTETQPENGEAGETPAPEAGSSAKGQEEKEDGLDDGELPPMDDTASSNANTDSSEAGSDSSDGESAYPGNTAAEPTPNIDPETGLELEEDELPIVQP